MGYCWSRAIQVKIVFVFIIVLQNSWSYFLYYNRSITKSYYRNSVGALLIYDITKRASFDHIPIWMNDAKRHIEPHRPVFVLVGCKLDLVSLIYHCTIKNSKNLKFYQKVLINNIFCVGTYSNSIIIVYYAFCFNKSTQ